MHIGGSPNFEMVDSKRIEINQNVLDQLAANADLFAQIELLLTMKGRVFNLANTVPDDVASRVKQAISNIVISVAASLETEANRSLSQNLLDLAGPPKQEGLMNCDPVANGWLFENVITTEAQASVRAIHERQWGSKAKQPVAAVGRVAEVHIGGSPNFEMMDSKRNEMNQNILDVLAATPEVSAQVELLLDMKGRVFNLANTVPDDITSKIKEALSNMVVEAADSLEKETSRSFAQNLLGLAGPPQSEGLMNCNPLANGWVFTNILTEAAQARVRAVHERQWGRPKPGGPPMEK